MLLSTSRNNKICKVNKTLLPVPFAHKNKKMKNILTVSLSLSLLYLGTILLFISLYYSRAAPHS